jgi:hypothetical protein
MPTSPLGDEISCDAFFKQHGVEMYYDCSNLFKRLGARDRLMFRS